MSMITMNYRLRGGIVLHYFNITLPMNLTTDAPPAEYYEVLELRSISMDARYDHLELSKHIFSKEAP